MISDDSIQHNHTQQTRLFGTQSHQKHALIKLFRWQCCDQFLGDGEDENRLLSLVRLTV
jgi:hypothetical protein